jgi:hypothetical protein
MADRKAHSISAARENNLFDEVEVGGGDQGVMSFVSNIFGGGKKADPVPAKKEETKA